MMKTLVQQQPVSQFSTPARERHLRRRYDKPAIRQSAALETAAMACSLLEGQGGGCGGGEFPS
ncbi:MAG: hypothetical protein QME96_02005 [Myxococcota bacterium]|nr:hypothetical protein [Myxococcota bacterium]